MIKTVSAWALLLALPCVSFAETTTTSASRQKECEDFLSTRYTVRDFARPVCLEARAFDRVDAVYGLYKMFADKGLWTDADWEETDWSANALSMTLFPDRYDEYASDVVRITLGLVPVVYDGRRYARLYANNIAQYKLLAKAARYRDLLPRRCRQSLNVDYLDASDPDDYLSVLKAADDHYRGSPASRWNLLYDVNKAVACQLVDNEFSLGCVEELKKVETRTGYDYPRLTRFCRLVDTDPEYRCLKARVESKGRFGMFFLERDLLPCLRR